MIDLYGLQNNDLVFQDTNLIKAKSVIEVQEGDLEYLPTFGCDYKYFLQSDILFQKESLKGHIMERLSQNLVPSDSIQTVQDLLDQRMLIGIQNKEK